MSCCELDVKQPDCLNNQAVLCEDLLSTYGFLSFGLILIFLGLNAGVLGRLMGSLGRLSDFERLDGVAVVLLLVVGVFDLDLPGPRAAMMLPLNLRRLMVL